MKQNPYEKFLSKEDKLLQDVGNYIKLAHPKAFFCHPYNEGRRTKFEQFKAKRLNLRAGLPDIMIFERIVTDIDWYGLEPVKSYSGLAIELKIKPNKPTELQIFALNELKRNGWHCEVCYNFDEAKGVIDNYFKK